MQTVLALILAVLMVLSMVACAQKTETPKNDTASTDAAASTTETTDTASTGETAANETLKSRSIIRCSRRRFRFHPDRRYCTTDRKSCQLG